MWRWLSAPRSEVFGAQRHGEVKGFAVSNVASSSTQRHSLQAEWRQARGNGKKKHGEKCQHEKGPPGLVEHALYTAELPRIFSWSRWCADWAKPLLEAWSFTCISNGSSGFWKKGCISFAECSLVQKHSMPAWSNKLLPSRLQTVQVRLLYAHTLADLIIDGLLTLSEVFLL